MTTCYKQDFGQITAKFYVFNAYAYVNGITTFEIKDIFKNGDAEKKTLKSRSPSLSLRIETAGMN